MFSVTPESAFICGWIVFFVLVRVNSRPFPIFIDVHSRSLFAFIRGLHSRLVCQDDFHVCLG
jgi:hypothetical protein